MRTTPSVREIEVKDRAMRKLAMPQKCFFFEDATVPYTFTNSLSSTSALFCLTGSVPGDYGVEVGVVHSSGISCLLDKEELRRVDCVGMMPSGVRCYDSGNLPSTKLPTLAATDYAAGQAAADAGKAVRTGGTTFNAKGTEETR